MITVDNESTDETLPRCGRNLSQPCLQFCPPPLETERHVSPW